MATPDSLPSSTARAAPRQPTTPPELPLEARWSAIGDDLRASFVALLDALPEGQAGPQRLARALGLDKVLLSRLLKALRAHEPLATLHHAPGPDPLRRLLKAARRAGADRARVGAAQAAVDAFEELIKDEAGDRSALDAILSAWVPEARAVFQLRRKQAAHRALAELKGVRVETQLSTVFLHPAADGAHLDVVWVMGLFGLRRLRPGVVVKLASRRMDGADAERRPGTLSGERIDPASDTSWERLRLDAYCQNPPASLSVARHGEVVHYVLDAPTFGPRADVDLVLAEVNLAEIPRFVPAGSGRKGYVFAEVAPPSRRLVFDAFVHRDVYPGRDPELALHETAFEGVASINDRGRDLDRLPLEERVESLGTGIARVPHPAVPRLDGLTRHVTDSMGWSLDAFRGYRVVIDYPLYGSQVSLAFEAPEG